MLDVKSKFPHCFIIHWVSLPVMPQLRTTPAIFCILFSKIKITFECLYGVSKLVNISIIFWGEFN